MPVLQNARHEAFAQELARGKAAEAAYQAAGYKPDRGNASRLTANDSIRARVAELKAQIADVVVRSTGADLARVVKELERVAFSDIGKVSSWEPEVHETIEGSSGGKLITVTRTIHNRVTITPSDKIDEDTRAAVASINQTPSGTLVVRMHDKIGR
jgi:phage terminase small subunit